MHRSLTALIVLPATLCCLGLPMSGRAAAHAVAYVSHPSHGAHFVAPGHQSGGGFFGHFFRSLLGVSVEPQPGQAGYESPADFEYVTVRPYAEVSVKSEAVRYHEATGRVLPRVHDLIVLPPNGPGADSTYIWPTSDAR